MSLLTLLVFLMSIPLCAIASEVKFESGPRRVHLLELFTSEGCSSCPPAEAWLCKLKDEPRLWREFVPVAFHVDYWDRLGWRDPFASKRWTARQYAYSAKWKGSSVYTPGFVLDGREWLNRVLPADSTDQPGLLRIVVAGGDQVTSRFSAEVTSDRGYDVHVARLGFGLMSDVKAGENSGRKLRHDFVVLALAEEPLAAGEKQLHLPTSLVRQPSGSREAIVAWVTERGQLEPIQATGGWLP